MALITFDRSELIPYVPRADREIDNPTVVWMKHVTFAAAQGYERKIQQGAAKNFGAMEKIAERTRQVQKQQFVENISRVERYYVRKPGEAISLAHAEAVSEGRAYMINGAPFLALADAVKGQETLYQPMREVTTPEDLYEVADGKLIIELLTAMEDSAKLTEGQLKNFASGSGTASAPGQES